MRTTAFGITAALLITGVILVASYHRNTLAFSPPFSSQGIFGSNKQYVFGSIDSIQNDNSGKPAWILTGFWKTNLLNQTQTNIAKHFCRSGIQYFIQNDHDKWTLVCIHTQ